MPASRRPLSPGHRPGPRVQCLAFTPTCRASRRHRPRHRRGLRRRRQRRRHLQRPTSSSSTTPPRRDRAGRQVHPVPRNDGRAPQHGQRLALPGAALARGRALPDPGATGSRADGALPTTADATVDLAMAASAGQVFLADTTDPSTPRHCRHGRHPCHDAVIDLVGYGAATNTFEGTAPGPGPGTTTALVPSAWAADSDNNGRRLLARCARPRDLRLHGAAGPPRRHHRRDPGHRHRHSPFAARHVTTDGRRHRGVPGRWLQRLLPPDRRHRRRHRRTPGASDADLRLRRDSAPAGTPAVGDLRRGDRPGQRVRRASPRSPRPPARHRRSPTAAARSLRGPLAVDRPRPPTPRRRPTRAS